LQSSKDKEQLERGRNSETPAPPSQTRPHAGITRRVALIVILVLLVLAAGTLIAAQLLKHTSNAVSGQAQQNVTALAANANGVFNFVDQPDGSGHSNTIIISINSLLTPANGYHYEAWFVDSTTKQHLALGALTLKNQVYSLTYSNHGVNLVGLGNEIDITLEHTAVTAPGGKVLLSAAFPPHSFVYVKRMLYSFTNTPDKIGLLVGLIEQAKLLNTVAHQLTTKPDEAITQCTAQSTLDIMEGQSGPNYKPLPANCAAPGITSNGDGYGLLGGNGYIANTQAQDLLANNQSDANSLIHEHSKHVTYGLQDMKSWLTVAQQDALMLLKNPAASGKAQELSTLANHAYYGYDANHDGFIEYAPGEAGAMISYQHGQFMTSLVLAPAS
jgi:hypothetical protein